MSTGAMHALMRQEFAFFVRKVAKEIARVSLPTPSYVDVMAEALERVIEGKDRRLCVCLPPRHLKTLTCTKALVAYILGREPEAEILFVTGSEGLADNIAVKIDEIMQSAFYRATFSTRLNPKKSRKKDFETTAGGAFFAVPLHGRFTGRGADYIIVDDAVEISEAGNFVALERANDIFDNQILTRLNHPASGRVVVVGQRLAVDDLPGHVVREYGFKLLSLPLIATREETFELRRGTFRRRVGDMLRPDAFTSEEIERMQARDTFPDFETLYQQNPEGQLSIALKRRHFGTFPRGFVAPSGIVLSIDCGQETGESNSFTVIQAWAADRSTHFLLDQIRARMEFDEMRRAVLGFIRRYRPSVVLIERTGMGPALISDLKQKSSRRIISVVPQASKAARLRAHVETIASGAICLPQDASFLDDFIEEFVTFPESDFADQIDATTQYLDFIQVGGPLPLRPAPATAALVRQGDRIPANFPGGALVLGSKYRRW